MVCRLKPWMRRAITRGIAIIPAAIVTAIMGNAGAARLLVLSQVIKTPWFLSAHYEKVWCFGTRFARTLAVPLSCMMLRGSVHSKITAAWPYAEGASTREVERVAEREAHLGPAADATGDRAQGAVRVWHC